MTQDLHKAHRNGTKPATLNPTDAANTQQIRYEKEEIPKETDYDLPSLPDYPVNPPNIIPITKIPNVQTTEIFRQSSQTLLESTESIKPNYYYCVTIPRLKPTQDQNCMYESNYYETTVSTTTEYKSSTFWFW